MSWQQHAADLDAAVYDLWGEAAELRAQGSGPAQPCRARFVQPDTAWQGRAVAVEAPARLLEVRVSEIANIRRGDSVTLAPGTPGAVLYRVAKAVQPGLDRRHWLCDLAP